MPYQSVEKLEMILYCYSEALAEESQLICKIENHYKKAQAAWLLPSETTRATRS